MANETIKNFFLKNALWFIGAAFTVNLSVFAFIAGTQLFQQSTTTHIQALENDVADIKLSIKDLTTISSKIEVIDAKVDSMNDRMDRQGEKIGQISDYLLKTK